MALYKFRIIIIIITISFCYEPDNGLKRTMNPVRSVL